MSDEDAGTPAAVVADAESWAARLRAGWLSAALVGVCTAMFLATLGLCAAQADRPGAVVVESFLGLTSCRPTFETMGALVPGRVWVDGEWWRTGTTELLHGSWLHLVLNAWSLWSVGVFAEAAWGRLRTLGLFVLSGLGGALASMAWAEAPMVVGASAGVLGIAGGLLVARLWGRAETVERLRGISPIGLGTTLLLLFGVGFIVPVIAQAGHVGGFVTGVAATWVGMQRGVMRIATGVILGFGGWQLAEIARQPDARAHYHEFVGFRHLERGESAESLAAFERALALEPGNAELANSVAYGLALAGRELDHADALVDLSLAEDPENSNYLDTKGWIACRRGDAETGMRWLTDADAKATTSVEEIRGHLTDCATAAAPPP